MNLMFRISIQNLAPVCRADEVLAHLFLPKQLYTVSQARKVTSFRPASEPS